MSEVFHTFSVDLETPGRSTRRSMDREASTVSAPASAGDPNASSSPKTSLPWSLPATPGREPSVLEMADTAGERPSWGSGGRIG